MRIHFVSQSFYKQYSSAEEMKKRGLTGKPNPCLPESNGAL